MATCRRGMGGFGRTLLTHASWSIRPRSHHEHPRTLRPRSSRFHAHDNFSLGCFQKPCSRWRGWMGAQPVGRLDRTHVEHALRLRERRDIRSVVRGVHERREFGQDLLDHSRVAARAALPLLQRSTSAVVFAHVVPRRLGRLAPESLPVVLRRRELSRGARARHAHHWRRASPARRRCSSDCETRRSWWAARPKHLGCCIFRPVIHDVLCHDFFARVFSAAAPSLYLA